jgi:UDP-hydrolysing UDP-N-acetyl-D-glucosamine 2-epimerase
MRKIAVVTGTRAEYGLLYWVIKKIHKAPELELQLIVTGMHLSPEFGLTVRKIEKDEFPITERVEMLLSSDTESAISTSMGLGMIGFAKAYERLRPDILLVLGDRFEILSTVAAAIPFRIPIAHIHGGESTTGSMDEQFRHAITKMSHIHFASTEKYKNRIAQMGELPERIFCFGSPGLDNIYKLELKKKRELFEEIGIPCNKKIGIVTYHPVTLDKNSAKEQIKELLNSLDRFKDIFWVFTMPNADTEGRSIISAIEAFTRKRLANGKAFTSLGSLNYLSLLKYSSIMVGNSSSGLLESPSFKLPVVNIGDRQDGRTRSINIIDIKECRKDNIEAAIEKALGEEFEIGLKGMENIYGAGNASEKIVEKLKTMSLDSNLIKKRFYDISNISVA